MAEFKVERAEFVEGAVGTDFDGTDGTIEQACDFFVVELLEAGEHEDLALGEGQLGEGGAEQGDVFGGGGLFRRRLGGVGLVDEIRRIGGDGERGVFAEMIGSDGAREVKNPGGKLAFVAVGVPVFQDAVENNLDEIFADGRLVGETQKETVEPPLVALEEFTELPDIAGADGKHEVVIGRGCHVGEHTNCGGAGGNS